MPNVQVTRLTLLCDTAPGPVTMELTGKQPVYSVLPHINVCAADWPLVTIWRHKIPDLRGVHPQCAAFTAVGVSTLERRDREMFA